MDNVVTVCGKSGSGKTAFIEMLVKKLSGDGIRVHSIKHSGKKLDIEKKGSDTYRHMAAGAKVVVGVAPGVLFRNERVRGEPSLQRALEIAGECDLVIVEGYKGLDIRRIEVVTDMSCAVEKARNPNVMACAGYMDGQDIDTGERVVPYFKIGDPEAINRAASMLRQLVVSRLPVIELKADSKRVELNDFVSKLFSNVLEGLLSSLKGVDGAREVTVRLRRSGPSRKRRN